jgi:hypothetical protein
MHHLERRLHARDMDVRKPHPFDWGLDFLGGVNGSRDPRQLLHRFNAEAIEDSEVFFAAPSLAPERFEFAAGVDGFHLRFPSALVTPYEKNNQVHARYFPAENSNSALIVSPQWNAQPDSHVGLCAALNKYAGVSALRLSLPYHDERMLEGFTRADYMVSANIGRTLQSVRQSVLDIRRAADWLFSRGYRRVGVVGTSIGSCVSWLAFIHDERLEAGVFNMVSSWFGDVVWRALTTTHIRGVLEREVTADELRELWRVISPSAHAHRLGRVRRPALCISAAYDLTFLPDLSRIFLDDCARNHVPAESVLLPCGHYTIGRTPFKYLDAFHIIQFFRRLWR